MKESPTETKTVSFSDGAEEHGDGGSSGAVTAPAATGSTIPGAEFLDLVY